MKCVKWIFVVLIFSSLTSFIGKGKPTIGLTMGHVAPDFKLENINRSNLHLLDMNGDYILLSFWSAYDAESRIRNIELNCAVQATAVNVKMVSISFDEYPSIFNEAVRQDDINSAICAVETAGRLSPIFLKYKLNKGFKTYLLNRDHVIVAIDLDAKKLSRFIN